MICLTSYQGCVSSLFRKKNVIVLFHVELEGISSHCLRRISVGVVVCNVFFCSICLGSYIYQKEGVGRLRLGRVCPFPLCFSPCIYICRSLHRVGVL